MAIRIGDLIKLLQLKPRYWWGIGVFGCMVLFLPEKIASTFGIESFRTNFRPYVGPATLAAFVLWIVSLIPRWSARRAEKQDKSDVLKCLESLSPDEWLLLAYCVDRGRRTLSLPLTNPPALALSSKGLFESPSGTTSILRHPYSIPNFVWEHLRRNPRRYFPQLFPKTRKVEELFESLEDKLRMNSFDLL